jgi:hypothetical protein
MLGDGARDARRTELYLDGLLSADERRASDVPADTGLDPEVKLAAQRLRSDLGRVHPSFRFEEALSAKLSFGAVRLRAGLPVEQTETPARPPAAIAFLRIGPVTAPPVVASAAPQFRNPLLSARPPRPLLVGGVGVASAAISIGAVYVAWRWSHASPTPMGRAARAAHGSRVTHPAGRSRRTAVLQGILGVVS